MDLSDFSLASEIEIGVDAALVGVKLIHERQRDLLRNLPQPIGIYGVVGEYDFKEDRRKSHRIKAEGEIDADNVISELLRSAAYVSL